jgi:hypothetical protein
VKGNLKEGAYDIRVLPAPRTLADFLGGNDEEARIPLAPTMRVSVAPDSILRMVSPSMANALRQQIRMAQQLEQRPIALMAPYTVTVK